LSIGLGIFASVVLVLLVYHRGFRIVAAWVAAVGAVLIGLVALGWYVKDQHDAKLTHLRNLKISACINRYGPDAVVPVLEICTANPDSDPWAVKSVTPAPMNPQPEVDWSSAVPVVACGQRTQDQLNRNIPCQHNHELTQYDISEPCNADRTNQPCRVSKDVVILDPGRTR
jgi:hypothetical protein